MFYCLIVYNQVCGEDSKDCFVELEPKNGELSGREEKQIVIHFTANREVRVCYITSDCTGLDQCLVNEKKYLVIQYAPQLGGPQQIVLGLSRCLMICL